MEEQSRPDEPPTAEDALPGTDPDELRERARRLQEEAADRTRAAAELRDAAAALREEAAALRERGPELAAEAEAADDPSALIDGPSEESPGQPPAEDSSTPRRWFRRGG
jgi:hypothetical protein